MEKKALSALFLRKALICVLSFPFSLSADVSHISELQNMVAQPYSLGLLYSLSLVRADAEGSKFLKCQDFLLRRVPGLKQLLKNFDPYEHAPLVRELDKPENQVKESLVEIRNKEIQDLYFTVEWKGPGSLLSLSRISSFTNLTPNALLRLHARVELATHVMAGDFLNLLEAQKIKGKNSFFLDNAYYEHLFSLGWTKLNENSDKFNADLTIKNLGIPDLRRRLKGMNPDRVKVLVRFNTRTFGGVQIELGPMNSEIEKKMEIVLSNPDLTSEMNGRYFRNEQVIGFTKIENILSWVTDPRFSGSIDAFKIFLD